jgi:hypothetical protein
MSKNDETSNGTYPWTRRSQRGKWLFIASTLLVCAGLLWGVPDALYADSMGSSSISFSDLEITAAGGTVSFGTWSSQAFAQAQNSLGGLDSDFTSNSGSSSAASAAVTFANAAGNASVTPLGGAASGISNVSGTIGQAVTTGQGILSTSTFEITGGTGVVNVTFSTDLSGEVQAANDAKGVLATAEATFILDVDGTPDLFFDLPISAGPSASIVSTFGPDLTSTMSLEFNTPYSLYVEADAETSAYNVAEPTTAVLLLIALFGVAACVYAAEGRGALGHRGSA